MGRRYSPQVLRYMEEHCGEGSLDWMRGELAERFGIRLSYSQIKSTYSNHKFHAKPGAGIRRGQKTFPPEVAEFIAANAFGHTMAWMQEQLRERYGIEHGRKALGAYYKRYGIRTGNDGRFRKGQQAYNKGKKMPEHVRKKIEATMFKKGQKPRNTLPVGAETKVDGYWKVKIGEPDKWQLKSRHEWERIHGEKLGRSDAVIFLDKNPDNFAPENLIRVSRSELARINQDNLRGEDPELNMAAVNLARLKDVAIRKKKERKKEQK